LIAHNIVRYVNDPTVINDVNVRGSAAATDLVIADNIFGPGCRMVQIAGGARNVDCVGNVFYNAYIELQTVYGCQIVGNTFYDDRSASQSFIQHTSAGSTPTNVRIADNHFRLTSASTQNVCIGDSVDGATRWCIESNFFESSVRPAISWRGTKSVIRNNYFLSDATANTTFRVISLEGTASDNRIVGNTIRTTQSVGASAYVLYDNSTGSGNEVWDNDLVSESSTQGVNITGTTNTSFSNINAARPLWTQVSSVTVSNTTTETSLLGSGRGKTTLPAQYLRVARRLRLQAWGTLSTAASPGTLTIRFKFGTVVVAATSAFTPTAGLANAGWSLNVDVICRSNGSTGTVMAQGRFDWEGTLNQLNVASMVNTTTATINSSTSYALDVTAQWGTASVSNNLTVTNLCITEEH